MKKAILVFAIVSVIAAIPTAAFAALMCPLPEKTGGRGALLNPDHNKASSPAANEEDEEEETVATSTSETTEHGNSQTVTGTNQGVIMSAPLISGGTNEKSEGQEEMTAEESDVEGISYEIIPEFENAATNMWYWFFGLFFLVLVITSIMYLRSARSA